ncbi:MAG: right-handed parallel beta-helix repeat-containing protein [Thermodesulfovibrionales bacterium]
MRAIRLIMTAAVSGILFMSLPATAERVAEDTDTIGEAIRTPQALDLKPFTTVRDGSQIIHLPAGTYRMSTTLRLPSNTVLEGAGDATLLKADSSFNGSQLITNSDYVGGNTNISIRNLRMEVTSPLLPGDEPGILRFKNVEQLVIDNLTLLIESPMFGIDLSAQIRNATVQGCTIISTNKMSGGGIMIRNGDPLPARATSSIVVRHNWIESASDEPVAAFGWEGMVENVLIEENTIKAEGASFGITTFGIDSRKQRGKIHDVSIIGNRISGSKVGGIGIKGGARLIQVIGNSIKDTEGDGIFLHAGGEGLPGIQDIRILQNKILNAGRHCIFATGTNIQVQENEITHCAQNGIYAAGNVSVVNNVISDAKPGILVYGKQGNDIRGNELRNAGGGVLFLNEDVPALKGKDAR